MKEISVITDFLPQHTDMVKNITGFNQEFERASSFFMKSQSQYMDKTMTVNHNTPLRNLRQILAEYEQCHQALVVNGIKMEYRKNKIKILERQMLKEKDELKVNEIQFQINLIQNRINQTLRYSSGTIRRLNTYIAEYKAITEHYGKDVWSEVDFEEQEDEYHIKKAFEQAICAARARGGNIDEGNHIYLSQIGINGGAAQFYVKQLLDNEAKALEKGIEPPADSVANFLEVMYQRYKGSYKKLLKSKGMTPEINHESALKIGFKPSNIKGMDLLENNP